MKPGALLVVAMLSAAPALAQDRRWEVEVYGGAALTASGEGARTLPPAGLPLVTTSPIFPSREVPSFFFGDGASLLNAVAGEFDASSRLTPLDDVFARFGRTTSGAFGARLRRRVTPRVWTEVAVDLSVATKVAPSGFEQTVEDARRSFAGTIGDLLRTGPFGTPVIEADAGSNAGNRRYTTVTGAVNIDLPGAFAPYATVGGGVVAASGALPSANLRGTYRFTIAGEVPIAETDSLQLRIEEPSTYTLVLGGGVRRALGGKMALRLDARVFVGPDTTRIRIDASPTSVRGTPAGFIESFTNPGIQFSNDPATGRRSTLSAPALENVAVFEGGIRARTLVSLGITRRF